MLQRNEYDPSKALQLIQTSDAFVTEGRVEGGLDVLRLCLLTGHPLIQPSGPGVNRNVFSLNMVRVRVVCVCVCVRVCVCARAHMLLPCHLPSAAVGLRNHGKNFYAIQREGVRGVTKGMYCGVRYDTPATPYRSPLGL